MKYTITLSRTVMLVLSLEVEGVTLCITTNITTVQQLSMRIIEDSLGKKKNVVQ